MAKIELFQYAKKCNPDSGIAGATLFEISNVVEGLRETSPISHQVLLGGPSTPPYSNLWVEWSTPSENFVQGGTQRRNTVARLGAHVLSEPEGDGWAVYPLFYFQQYRTKCIQIGTAFRLKLNAQGVVVDRTFKHIPQGETKVKAISLVTEETLVTRFMKEINSGENRTPPNLPRTTEENIRVLKAWSQASMAVTAILYYRFFAGLLHVKNIDIIDSAKGKHGKRKGRHKGIRHYTLRIRPIGRRSARGSQSTGDKNAFHFARGHFKTYTEENPLFGKHVGTYWWDAHARGSKAKGTITKDYEVYPAKENEEITK